MADAAGSTATPTSRVGHQGLFFERFYVEPGATVVDPALTPNAAGLYYNRNRWYSPELGRFVQRDPNETATPILTALASNGESLSVLFGALPAAHPRAVVCCAAGVVSGGLLRRTLADDLLQQGFQRRRARQSPRLPRSPRRLNFTAPCTEVSWCGPTLQDSLAWADRPIIVSPAARRGRKCATARQFRRDTCRSTRGDTCRSTRPDRLSP